MKLTLKNVTKKYKQRSVVNNVSIELNEPKIYALLGRNGAGKTTMMDMIAGHILPSSGEILVNGEAVFDNRHYLKDICLIKEGNNFHPDMRVKDVLQAYATVYENWNGELAQELVKVYHLPLKGRVKTLSKGMVSSLGVIIGLASGAKITIFDEPYIGMDAAARQKFYTQLLDVYEADERMIIFSTHLIDEASLLFEEIFILKEGEIILRETVDVIRDQAFSVTGDKDTVTNFVQDKQVMKTKQLANVMTAYVYGDKGVIPEGLQVDGIPIQDVMIYLTEMEGETE